MRCTSFLALIGVCVNSVAAFGTNRLANPYLTRDVPNACVAVVAGNNSDAYIRLIPDSKTEIPVLVVRHHDVLSNNLPLFEAYNGNNIDVKDSKFVVSSGEPLFNGPLSGDNRIAVTETDIYCVYTALDKDSSEGITVIPRNKHGYLDFQQYCLYSQLKLSWVMGVVVATFLFYRLVAHAGNDFSNLNSLSVVSKGTIYLIIIPSVFSYTLQLVCGLVTNNIARIGFLTKAFVTLLTLVSDLATSVVMIAVLIFCMGEGVIYYHKTTVSFRQMPDRSKKFAIGLLVCNYVTASLAEVALMFSTPSSYRPVFEISAYGPLASLWTVLNAVTVLCILVAYVYYYRQTRNTIQTYPPFGDEIEDAAQRNATVLSAFKRSFFIIFFIPFIAGLFIGAISFARIMKSQASLLDDIVGVTDPDVIAFFAYKMQLVNRGLLTFSIAVNVLTSFAVIVAIYYIWIRRNFGLVVDQKEVVEETGLSRYDIESEDDNVVL